MKRTLFCFIALLLTTNLKAQDDPNVGFYVDGVKVTEINCANFKTLTIVIHYNSAWGSFEKFIVKATFHEVLRDARAAGTLNTISNGGMLSKVKKGYIIYEIFSAITDSRESANGNAQGIEN